MYDRRICIDILLLYERDKKFIHKDIYGNDIKRLPILQTISNLFHDNWGVKGILDRKRVTKINELLSYIEKLNPKNYVNEAEHFIPNNFLNDSINLSNRQRNRKIKSYFDSNDYPLNIIIHL